MKEERVICMLQQYKNILVPVDGSKEAELAFKKAVAVTKEMAKMLIYTYFMLLIRVHFKISQVMILVWLMK